MLRAYASIGIRSMRDSFDARVALMLLSVIAIGGCSRSKYRLAADREAYDVIAERNGDPRWHTPDYDINIDPRSRYFDSYNPDRPPMPRDDPAANQYMHCVDGMKGWKHWYDNGVRLELENPGWRQALSRYVQVEEDGAVKLDINSALKLAYVNSPVQQNQLETLYLSALDVTTERFRLDTQFFGGYDVNYVHQGSLIPAALTFDPVLRRFVINPPIEGAESNRLTVGRPFGANPALLARRRFATAGELVAGFANSFVFEFTGTDANLSASLLNFTFLQPLLRGAGKDIALEQLTFAERVLLANLRSYEQFRQGFYTQVAVGELGVTGPQRGGRGTNLQIFSGQAGLSGYVGLLQQLQQIRNSEDNLSLQLRTLAQLEALLDAGVIDLVQVDQFRQSVESERASLLQSKNSYLTALDRFKTSTLGLPPNLPVDLDDDLIRQFQLVDREATGVQDAISNLQDRVGLLPDDADAQTIEAIQAEVVDTVQPVRRQLDAAKADIAHVRESVPAREKTMDEFEAEQFALELEQLDQGMTELERQFAEVKSQAEQIQAKNLGEGLEADENNLRDTVILLRNMLRLVQGSILVQARSRLESVTVETIDLSSEDAFQIALANRLDFMNGRAALVDSWRLIEVSADALQSVLNVSASGDVRTARNNPVSFRAATSNVRLGLEFDAPFTRLEERNSYRESLINYQRSRREFIQSRDSLHLGLRVLLREIEQLRTNLEIQRRAVAIAIRRVDLTRAALYAPVPPPRPGQRAAQFGPTAAINLLSAQSALRDTQNSFLSVWLNYYAAKMRLSRELGVMMLDPEGQWIEMPPPSSAGEVNSGDQSLEVIDEAMGDLPPPVPAALLDSVENLPEGFVFEVADDAAALNGSIKNAGMIE
jgi:outer membrane protein TolC